MRLLSTTMAFYFLLGSFLPQSDFSQLGKLGRLLEHYEFHQQAAAEEGDSFTFLEYIYIHFIHPDQHEHGDQSHQDLPLHAFQPVLQVAQAIENWQLSPLIVEQLPSFGPVQAYLPRLLAVFLLRPPIS